MKAMILKKKFLLFGLVAFILASCASPANDIASLPTTPSFFDLKSFFQNEIKKLADVRRIEKVTNVNGKEEKKIMDSVDIATELEIFTTIDINRPAWMDKYSVDSIFQNNELVELKYETTDEKLKTKKVVLSFENQSVKEISILNLTKSSISDSQQVLKYFPNKGYEIQRQQKMPFLEKQLFKVEVAFL